MLYVALVSDMNPVADAWVEQSYVTPTPTCFFDGGYRNMMGGFPTPGPSLVPYYEPEIVACAQRAVPALDLLTAIDWLGNYQVRVHVAIGNGVPANTAPATPAIALGGGRIPPEQIMTFACEATDPQANMIFYQWDWGDGQMSGWLGPYNSGATAVASHSWAEFGSYSVRVKVRDPFGEETAWSAPVSVTVSCCMGRVGDANQSGEDEPTIGDVTAMIDAKFISGSCDGILSCVAEADVNQSAAGDPTCEDISIGDITILIDYLFITGPTMGLPNCL
ncbi:MAG: PKD domain-containing protein [Candidatus Zixiibacteriota bacterium]